MSIPKLTSTCADNANFLEGIYKAYADCQMWCAQKCPNDPSPLRVKQMIDECKRECRFYQARSPAGQ
jgi:hypothetical protein